MIGSRAKDPNLDAVLRIGTCEAIKAVDARADIQVVDRTFTNGRIRVRIDRYIDRSPPYVLFGSSALDDALVLR